MNWALFRYEVRGMLAYTLIWTLVLVFSTVANVAGSVSGENADMVVVFAQSFLNMLMMNGIFAMILGGLVISHEESEKTIEFLLGQPVTRFEIAISKIAAFVLLVAILNAVLLVADLIMFRVLGSGSAYGADVLVAMWLSGLALVFLLGAAGLLISMGLPKPGAVVGIGIGVPIVTAVLAALGNVDSLLLRALSYASPYRYIDTSAIMLREGAQAMPVIIFVALAVGLIIATITIYRRKEFAA